MHPPPPVNLAERFPAYRITWDFESLEVKGDPWMMRIPCKFGFIYPHGYRRPDGTGLLGISCDYHPRAQRQLAALPQLKPHQTGDGEMTWLFEDADFDTVAAIVQPKLKRKISSAEHLAKYRFSPRHNEAKTDPPTLPDEPSRMNPPPAPSASFGASVFARQGIDTPDVAVTPKRQRCPHCGLWAATLRAGSAR